LITNALTSLVGEEVAFFATGGAWRTAGTAVVVADAVGEETVGLLLSFHKRKPAATTLQSSAANSNQRRACLRFFAIICNSTKFPY
jgi:hypothetical protein